MKVVLRHVNAGKTGQWRCPDRDTAGVQAYLETMCAGVLTRVIHHRCVALSIFATLYRCIYNDTCVWLCVYNFVTLCYCVTVLIMIATPVTGQNLCNQYRFSVCVCSLVRGWRRVEGAERHLMLMYKHRPVWNIAKDMGNIFSLSCHHTYVFVLLWLLLWRQH